MARYDENWKKKVKAGLKDYYLNLSDEAREKLRAQGKAQSFRLHPRKKLSIEECTGWNTIRAKLFEQRGRKCEKCGWSEENQFNHIIPVQIDHINGNNKDHRIENLIILCPNCHSLTEHFMFYGRKHKRFG